MNERVALTFFEIDIKYCDLVYGEAPCTAEIGVTGDSKCFNTRNFSSDCQDPWNYSEIYHTIRFGMDGQPFVSSMPCIPSMTSCDVKNAEIHPGEDIGVRAEFSVAFKNHPHGDAGIDKYISDRTYNPFNRGTFWGKFRARNPYIQNVPCRVVRGYVGDPEYDIEHFVLSSMSGPDSDGRVRMNGRDFMHLLGDKSAQAPKISQGYLSTDISDSETTIILEPAGVGDTYPASGMWSVGEELMSFTKTSGDTFSVVRGEGGTFAGDHSFEDAAQITLEYSSETVADIIYDLVVNYSPISSDHIDLPLWQGIVTEFSDALYSARIVKPTSVESLINELVEQAGLVINGNTRTQMIDFDVLRPNAVSGQIYDQEKIRSGSFKQTDQPRKRFSQVWIFYNQRDIFKNLEDPSNFYSAYVDFPPENLYETDSIKKIYSRWIPRAARSVAHDVASRAISRYVNPPRLFGFGLFAGESPQLGAASPITHPMLEDCTGEQEVVDAIITGIKTTSDGFMIRAEELKFDASLVDLARTFTIDYDSYNLNLRAIYDATYAVVDEVNPITFIISTGVVVGSATTGTFSIESGNWPAGVEPTLILMPGSYCVGSGGNGGYGGGPTGAGKNGGPALLVTSPITVVNDGVIGGGGGGGGGSSTIIGGGSNAGGGGAGRIAGSGMVPGGLTNGGGVPGITGGGGNLGVAGTSGTHPDRIHAPGGPPGVAVDGDSMITWAELGDIRGARIG